jgi:hypothetical protein
LKIYPGMQALVTFAGETPVGLVVPRSAVIGPAVPGGPATVVTVSDNRAARTAVRLGVINDHVAQITSGLSEGDVVAVANAGGLSNGQVVAAIGSQVAEVSGAQ